MKWFPWSPLLFAALFAYPFIPGLYQQTLGSIIPGIFLYAILGLALNVVLGYTGQLHLGIAAFFGIGAVTAGVLRTDNYPFLAGFWETILAATVIATIVGVLVSSPTLRLRGDYLALVTLGFGMITVTLLRKFEEITGGKKTLAVKDFVIPESLGKRLMEIGIEPDWVKDYRLFYYLCLGFLTVIFFSLRNLERSRLGRAWFAVREDELAASCMGINVARVKLGSFALGAGLAGLAGALYTIYRHTTLEPNNYEFQLSATILCAVILGGLGSRLGVLLGIFFIFGFENLFAPMLDSYLQQLNLSKDAQNRFLQFNTWKMLVYGLALILVMRFRPNGLLPAVRGEAKRA